jgi:hypothetical protein
VVVRLVPAEPGAAAAAPREVQAAV